MITEKNGRSRSERTPEEDAKLLEQDIASLSPDELDTLQSVMKEIGGGEKDPSGSGLLEMLGQAEYKSAPVDMRTFVLDRYYLGNTCDNIYPKLLDDLIELFDGDYHEVIYTGSIGWGKTFVASIALSRIIYEISCMKDPHKSFGMAKDSNISIVALSVNETLATKVVFENIATKIKASPYFQEHFTFSATKKELRFPGNIWVAARSSTDTSVLGLNTISGMIDESNFMSRSQQQKASHIRWGHYDHAESLYNAIKRRMKSRFERRGNLPGKLFVVSSKQTLDDFTARRIHESRNDPKVFVRDYATWDVKPEEYYEGNKFHVLCGNEQIHSRILGPDDNVDALKKKLPEGVLIIDVPDDFRMDFERDLEGAIRDIAGVATVAISPFIQRREKILEAVDRREHPFSTLSYDPAKGGSFLWDRMVQSVNERLYGVEAQRSKPILNPHVSRHIHIDPSLTGDSTGFCMSHIAGWKDVERRSEDGKQYIERAPVFVVDVILQVTPPLGDEIELGDTRRLVYELSAHGYTITCVSMDSWQSVDAIQQLARKGYKSETVSVDLTPQAYDTLKTSLYENRLFFYNYEPLIGELQQLEENKTGKRRKIDHPVQGSKDCSDALAGCLFTLARDQAAEPLPIMRGALESGIVPNAGVQLTTPAAGQSGAVRGFGVLPPFLTSSSSWDDDWSGGWNPGSM